MQMVMGAKIEARAERFAGFFIPAPPCEAAMTQTTHPSKQLVRDFMDARTRSVEPPPTPDEIRRQLGWDLLPQNRRPGNVDEP
jgi:hypothetical protein